MVDVEDLAIQNPWWEDPTTIDLDELVREALLKDPPVLPTLDVSKNVAYFGPRQVGKTTSIKLTIRDLLLNQRVDPRNICYFSCDLLESKTDVANVVRAFNQLATGAARKYLFLDEVTSVPEWEKGVKFVLDSGLCRGASLVVTGSSAAFLRRGTERMPGRDVKVKQILPLGFRNYVHYFGGANLREVLGGTTNFLLGSPPSLKLADLVDGARQLGPFIRSLNQLFDAYLKTGGYFKPIYELRETGRISRQTHQIYVNWVLGEAARLNLAPTLCRQVAASILENYGSSFSLNSVAKRTSIGSHKTVDRYLEKLQELMLVNQVRAVEVATLKPVYRKNRKAYFTDPFLGRAMHHWTRGRDWPADRVSLLVEGVVAEELARLHRQNLDVDHFLWYFRGAKEVDFVVNLGEVTGVEVKWRQRVSMSDFSSPRVFQNRLVLSKRDLILDEETKVVPVSIFLALLRGGGQDAGPPR
ncbi:MAG: ATP-binding protein [Promethearchaeota archaeon]